MPTERTGTITRRAILSTSALGLAGYGGYHLVRDSADEQTSSESASSGSSLRVNFPSGRHYGLHRDYDPSPNQTEMHMTYRIRFDADYEFEAGTKLPGWAIKEGYGSGDEPNPNGTNGWSCKPKLGRSGQLAQYVYHMDMTREYGENFEIVPDFPLGEWVKVTQRLKLNTVASDGSANHDGLFEVWVNGTKERRETGLRFSTVPESQGMNVQMVFYYGGETPSPQDQGLNFDEFALSSEPLMPLPNRLVIRGTGTETNYEFTTEGDVFPTGRNGSRDTVSENTANAWITDSGSVDEWLFGERVTSFRCVQGGPVELELNGRSVDPSVDPTSWNGYNHTVSPGEAPHSAT